MKTYCDAAKTVALLICCLVGSIPASRAGIVVIGTLSPSTPLGVTPGMVGLAFDGTPNPLVIDRWSWTLTRVSLEDASVLSVTNTSPVPTTYSSQLAYDPTGGNFYTIAGHSALVRIGATFQNTPVGAGVGAFFNFVGMASDSAGKLWLATDKNGGQLWAVDKLTGVGAIHTAVSLPTKQITSLMIDAAGNFIVYGRSTAVGSPSYFYYVDPNTGATTIAAEGWSDPFSSITTMAYDPVTKGYYGILTTGGTGFNQLVQITGLPVVAVPEPSSIVLALAGLMVFAYAAGARGRSPRNHARA